MIDGLSARAGWVGFVTPFMHSPMAAGWTELELHELRCIAGLGCRSPFLKLAEEEEVRYARHTAPPQL